MFLKMHGGGEIDRLIDSSNPLTGSITGLTTREDVYYSSSSSGSSTVLAQYQHNSR